ncbi:hypothetical protein [Enterococcus thailandicus]|uniref:hypothetical protein n=1 Tax=Enterococcus thailandicus TaxID=417368 RepID=UPI0022E0DCEE|nr:hypothetical protein [Enterococcus thailandicus]
MSYEHISLGNSYELEILNSKIEIINPLLFNAINQLSVNKKNIIIFFYFVGFNDREIAVINNMSVSGIWYQRQQAIKDMRNYLEKESYE